jgi:hypothetical protein
LLASRLVLPRTLQRRLRQALAGRGEEPTQVQLSRAPAARWLRRAIAVGKQEVGQQEVGKQEVGQQEVGTPQP